MAAADWYPASVSNRVGWHANFKTQATASGTAHGLSAGQVTQIGKDADDMASMNSYTGTLREFSESWTEFIKIVMGGPSGPMPAVPTPPVAYVPTTTLAGIEARTRMYAGLIRATVDYTPAVGEQFGIIGPSFRPPATPSLKVTALTGSQVRLKIAKNRFKLIAIDSRRGGGAWESIGPSQTAVFVDSRPPLVAGQPEQREYRCQGVVNNERVGGLSLTDSAVTVP